MTAARDLQIAIEELGDARGRLKTAQQQYDGVVTWVNSALSKLAVIMPPENIESKGPIPYSQNDPPWNAMVYALSLTFAQAGCYVCCVAMLNTLTGSAFTPPQVTALMRKAGCFDGEMLSKPHLIPLALPDLEWPAGAYWNRQGASLSNSEWDMVKSKVLVDRALILKVDYKPENKVFNMHFVLAVDLRGDDDLVILDPIDGKRASLVERYGAARGWSVKQAIFGYRGLRVKR